MAMWLMPCVARTALVAWLVVVMGGGVGRCEVGVMTRHDVMEAVLRNRPERVAEDVDGYIATVECSRMGERLTLVINGRSFRVAVADCATSAAVGVWPTKGGRIWLGDVEKRLWEAARAPGRPVGVMLCQVP